jgi:uncharacterized protein
MPRRPTAWNCRESRRSRWRGPREGRSDANTAHDSCHGDRAVARAFLVAKTAIDEGDAVTLFLAGDAVQLMRDGVLDNLSGLGTGKLRDLFDAIAKGGGRFYLSGMSSNARGVSENDLKGKPAEFATPSVLLRPAKEHDRMFTY